MRTLIPCPQNKVSVFDEPLFLIIIIRTKQSDDETLLEQSKPLFCCTHIDATIIWKRLDVNQIADSRCAQRNESIELRYLHYPKFATNIAIYVHLKIVRIMLAGRYLYIIEPRIASFYDPYLNRVRLYTRRFDFLMRQRRKMMRRNAPCKRLQDGIYEQEVLRPRDNILDRCARIVLSKRTHIRILQRDIRKVRNQLLISVVIPF